MSKLKKKYVTNWFVLALTILNLHAYTKNNVLSHKDLENEQMHIVKLKNQDNILNLEGTKNTRYLGICDDVEGNSLNHEAFLRSDNTDDLTEGDLRKLKKLNVKTVIDLRYPNEVKKNPDKFANVNWVKYHNITIAVNRKYPVYDSYIKALECKKLIKNVFETIANAEKGTILFHCTHGKDRTGILAMLLLKISNVPDDYIVKDYAESYCFDCSQDSYNKEYEKSKEHIKKIIEYIINTYETFDNYLLSTGLSKESLSKVKKRMSLKYVDTLTDLQKRKVTDITVVRPV